MWPEESHRPVNEGRRAAHGAEGSVVLPMPSMQVKGLKGSFPRLRTVALFAKRRTWEPQRWWLDLGRKKCREASG